MLADTHHHSAKPTRPAPRATTTHVLLPVLFLIAFSVPVLVRLFFDLRLLGDGWRQGDWLINFGAGPVRRGLFGEAFIWLSDTAGLGLLKTVIFAQAGLWIALAWLFWLIWRRHANSTLMVLLLASPMAFFMVWSGDQQGIMRKEILGYLAFALLVLASLQPRPAPLLATLGVAFFTLGCIGNILHLFLAPAMLAGLYLLKEQHKLTHSQWMTLSGVSVLMALFWFGFALANKEIPQLAGVCEPLLQRGMGPEICEHAIRWLVAGDVDHGAQVAVRITSAAVAQFATVAALGVLPLVLVAYHFNAWRRVAIIALICFVPMLPLYVIATDWGRWFSISYTVAACLILVTQAGAPVPKLRRPSGATLSLLLVTSLLLTPAHGIGWQAGGVIQSLWKTVTDLT